MTPPTGALPESQVVIATDGSELALGAARLARTLFRPDAEYTVVHVVPYSELSNADLLGDSGMTGPALSPEQAAARDDRRLADAREVVTRTIAALGAASSTSRVEVGDPATVVCDAAQAIGASAIVMGTHSRGPLGQVLLGSVSQHVVRHAPCPVLLVGSSAAQAERGEHR